MSDVNIGINKENRKKITDGLSKVLADSYVLYLKTQNFHWNVTGPHFRSLHHQFEEQYKDLAAAIDEIAERIRILGFRAPGTLEEFADLTSIKEKKDQPDAMEMVKRLAADNEAIHKTIQSLVEVCDEAGDEATADMLIVRLQIHSETAWILRSHLE